VGVVTSVAARLTGLSQGDGISPRGIPEPLRCIVRGTPHRFRHVGLSRHSGRLPECGEDGLRVGCIGLGNHVLDGRWYILGEACGWAIARLNQLEADAEPFEFMRE
jgi:hypothetical protein